MNRLGLMATFIGAVSLLCGCNHEHDKNAKWQYDENNHWRVCSCGKEFDRGEHSIDENDCNCHTCGYHDPMFVVDEYGYLSGLTNFGKNYKGVLEKDDTIKHNAFSKVTILGENAFEGCQASKIIVPENVNVKHDNAFKGTTAEVKYEEEGEGKPSLIWTETDVDGYRYKENVYKNNVAMVNGLFYPTLKEAIDNVKEDNTIVKIVRADVNESEGNKTEVKHKIILESHVGTTNLNTNFDITSNGQLFIDKSIKFKGSVNLIATEDAEKCGYEYQNCYTTGSVIFPGKEITPDGINVFYDYVQSEGGAHLTKKASGTKQIYKDEIENKEITGFIYGTFKFSKDFNTITGLTKFGKTITELTIKDFIKERTANISLCKNAFNIKDVKNVEITLEGITKLVLVDGYFQKGIFSQLIIENGLKEISEEAFNADYDRKFIGDKEQKVIEKQINRLTYVKLGNCVEIINERAFKDCESLITVTGGTGLKEIKSEAFYECEQLENADFSSSKSLRKIGKEAFSHCTNLNGIDIPHLFGWRTEDNQYHFAPLDLNPRNFKNILVSLYQNHNILSDTDNHQYKGVVYAYHPNDKDGFNIHNKAVNFTYLSDLNKPEIYNNIKDESIVRVSQEYFDAGYAESDKDKEINITAGHSVYIKNDANTKLILNKINVPMNAYVILDENIEVTNGINLVQGNMLTGSVGFTYKHEQTGNTKVTTNGYVSHGIYPTRINFNGEELDNCSVYGICGYTKHSTYHVVNTLSKLGRLCKDLRIGSQNEDESWRELVIEFNFSKDNQNLETLAFDYNVQAINSCKEMYMYSGEMAFDNCKNLKTVKINDQMKIIGKRAFSNCTNLSKVDFSESNSLTAIGENCFLNCGSLTTFDLSDQISALRLIEQNAFKNTGLTSFHMPNRLFEGWKAGGTAIDPNDLSDDVTAANLLRSKYVGRIWKR